MLRNAFKKSVDHWINDGVILLAGPEEAGCPKFGRSMRRGVSGRIESDEDSAPQPLLPERPQLFCCSFDRYEDGGRVKGFAASVARNETDFRSRLFERFGAMVALGARVRRGFDQFDRAAVTLVSEPMSDWLARASVRPGRMAPKGLDYVVERRRLG